MNLPKSSVLLGALLLAPIAAHSQKANDSVRHASELLRADIDTLIAKHQYASVERCVHERLARGDDPATTYFQIGKIYFDREEWSRSAEFLQKSLKLKNSNDEAHQLLGLDWRKLHRPDDAEAELLEAAKQDRSNKVDAYFAGHQLLLNGKFEAALPYLYSALDSKPLEAQALQALAFAQARLGNYGLAETYYHRAIDSGQLSNDGLYAAFLNLSILLLLGHDPARLAEGLAWAERAGKLQPDSSDVHFLTGKALFKLGRLSEARLELSQAAKLNPQDSKPHFLLAQIYDQLGRQDLAQKERDNMVRVLDRAGQGGMAAAEVVPVKPE